MDRESLEKRPAIVIVGSPNVGKRTLISRLLKVDFEDASDHSSKLFVHGWTINTKYYTADVSVWMAHLSDDFSITSLPILDRVVSLVMVFDVSDLSSLIALKNWVSHTDIQNYDILLCIGNKVDLLPSHPAHTEYKRRLLKRGESSCNNSYMDSSEYGISETEGSSLLGDEKPSWDIKRAYSEWCLEHNIEYVEACASNADFDRCLSLDGDSQGVERLYGALSAHMWPGMVLKSGDKINEPSLPEEEEGSGSASATRSNDRLEVEGGVVEAAGIDSLVTEDELEAVVGHLGLDLAVMMPGSGDRATAAPPGFVTLFLEYFKFGFTIPYRTFLGDILGFHQVCVSQLSPQCFGYLEGFFTRLPQVGIPIELSSFRTLFSVKQTGSYPYVHMQSRVQKFVEVSTSRTTLWRKKFFFFHLDQLGFVTPTVWNLKYECITAPGDRRRRGELYRSNGLFELPLSPSSPRERPSTIPARPGPTASKPGGSSGAKLVKMPISKETAKGSKRKGKEQAGTHYPEKVKKTTAPARKRPWGFDVDELLSQFPLKVPKVTPPNELERQICANSGRNVQLAREMRVQNDKLKERVAFLEREAEARREASKALEGRALAAEKEKEDLARERDASQAKYEEEARTGRRFQKSTAWKELVGVERRAAVEEFRGSSEYERELSDRAGKAALTVVGKTVRRCRADLRAHERYIIDDFAWLCPQVPEVSDYEAEDDDE